MATVSLEKTTDSIPAWDNELLAQSITAAGGAVYCWDIVADRMEWSGGAAEALSIPVSPTV